MISGYIDEVLIKEAHPAGIDKVFIVRNLPKHLLYREVANMVPRVDRDGYQDGSLVVDQSGKKVEALLEGLEHSRTDDGSIVFHVKREPGRNALEAIDQYIAGTLPRDVVVPKRVPYPAQPGDPRSMPISRSRMPAIDLPKPIDRVAAEEISPAGNAASSPRPRVLSEDARAKRAANAAKARAAKAAKKAQ